MLTVQYAKDPVWATAEQIDAINLIVKFEEFPEEMPFTATSYDCEPYGVQIYNNALNGDYGTIAPYVPNPPLDQPISNGTQQA